MWERQILCLKRIQPPVWDQFCAARITSSCHPRYCGNETKIRCVWRIETRRISTELRICSRNGSIILRSFRGNRSTHFWILTLFPQCSNRYSVWKMVEVAISVSKSLRWNPQMSCFVRSPNILRLLSLKRRETRTFYTLKSKKSDFCFFYQYQMMIHECIICICADVRVCRSLSPLLNPTF